MDFEIKLKDLRFHSPIGVFEEEKLKGNDFIVNLSVIVPLEVNSVEDDIVNTVSYADLYRIIEEEMKIVRNLLESVVAKIAERLKSEFPAIKEGRVEVEKLNPPIPGMTGSASVSLHWP